MSDRSAIEWTDATWNPTRGCTKISPGCKHCYAETFAERWRGIPGHAYEQGFEPRIAPAQLAKPLHWSRPRRIFVDSMSDLFHRGMPREYIAAVWAVMGLARRHTYQVLTKRAAELEEFLPWLRSKARAHGCTLGGFALAMAQRYSQDPLLARDIDAIMQHDDDALDSVWLGVSVEDRKYGLPRIEHLRRTPAEVRFLSLEPLLEDLAPELDLAGIDWVIVGGESGHGARPLHPDWVRKIRDKCAATGVPFFFKQWGEFTPIDKPWRDESPRKLATNEQWLNHAGGQGFHGQEVYRLRRVGKKSAGNLLDGRQHLEYPVAAGARP